MSKQATLTISPPDPHQFANAHVRPDKCARTGCHNPKLDESDFCAACHARGLVEHEWRKLTNVTCDNLTACHSQDSDCSGHVVDDVCTVCHAGHGDPCPSCHGRAYHESTCPETSS